MAPKPTKTQAQRTAEAVRIRAQLEEFGFPEETLTDIKDALRDFVNGYGVTKTYVMRDLGVSVLLLLSLQPHVTSYARLRKV